MTVAAESSMDDDKKVAADDKTTKESVDVFESASRKVTMRSLFRYASCHEWLMICIGCALGFAIGGGLPAVYMLLGEMVDALNTQDKTKLIESVEKLTLIFIYVGIAQFFASFASVACLKLSAESLTQKMRIEYLRSLMKQEIAWFDEHKPGIIASKLTELAIAYNLGIGSKFSNTFTNIGMFSGGLLVGFIYSPKMAAVCIAILPLIALAGWLMKATSDYFNEKMQTAYANAGHVAVEALSSLRTVASFSREHTEISRYESSLEEARVMGVKKGFGNGIAFGTINACFFFGYGIALWYGAELVAESRKNDPTCIYDVTRDSCFTGGTVMEVFFSVFIGSFALGQIAPNISALNAARSAASTIFDVIDRIPSIDSLSTKGSAIDRAVFKGKIEFKDVTFAYPTRKEDIVLDKLNLIIEAGQTVAFVGASGCGKSTITQLVQRFYDPSSGEILIDGVNLRDINLQSYRGIIGVVSQEPRLFATTIGNNIRFGSIEASIKEEQIIEAAESADAHRFISTLSDKYETNVGDRGAKLSGGQKQRIAIARAMIRKPSLLILDEATSALDNKSEREVQKSLDKLLHDGSKRTTLVIAHRLSTIRNANCIIVLDKGQVVEKGTHDELMAIEDGHYRKLALLSRVSRSRVKSSDHKSPTLTALKIATPETVLKLESSEESDEEIEDTTALQTKKEVDDDDDKTKIVVGGSEPVVPSSIVIDVDDSSAATLTSPDLTSPHRPFAEAVVEEKKDKDKTELEKREKEAMLKFAPVPKRRIWAYQAHQWYLFVFGTLASLGNGAVMPVFSLFLADMISTYFKPDTEQMKTDSLKWLGVFFAIGGANVLFNTLQSYLFASIGEGLTMRLRSAAFQSALRQEVGFHDFEEHSAGRLASRLASDAALVRQMTGENLGLFSQNLSAIGVGLGIAFSQSWQMTLVMFAALPLIGVAAGLETTFLSGSSDKSANSYEESGHIVFEAVTGMRTVHAFGMHSHILNLFQLACKKGDDFAYKQSYLAGIAFGASQAVQFIVYGICFYAGGRLLNDNYINFGEFFACFMVIAFTAYGAGQAVGFAGDRSKAEPATRSLFALIDRKSKIDPFGDSGIELTSERVQRAVIEFRNVSFSYPTRPLEKALDQFSLIIPSGKMVAFVGPSGCGKSTIIQLLLRFYDPSSGEILLDGVDLKQYNVRSLRMCLGLVSQEPSLFHEAIGYNVAYGIPPKSIDDTQIVWKDDEGKKDILPSIQFSTRLANIGEFIEGLPHKYDEDVGASGSKISGGQKQRIAIARAISRNPAILLLDEATSALDSKSEVIVQEALDNIIKSSSKDSVLSRTTLVIAHRLSTIRDAHLIVGMDAGRVVEQGSHAELLSLDKGLYRKLVMAAEDIGSSISPIATPVVKAT